MIQRKAIKIQRTSIKLPMDIKMDLKLKEAQELCKEEDILEMSKHYDMMVVKYTKKGGYRSLNQGHDHKKHRNWKHFERVWEVCRMKEWDTKLYIESQFDRVKYWSGRFDYPQPSSMYSVRALKYFVSYLGNIVTTYEKDMYKDRKKKGQETVSLRSQIIEEIVKSADILSSYLQSSTFEDLGQYKLMKVYYSWKELSPYYLYSIPWFREVLDEAGDSGIAEHCRKEFQRIDSSESLKRLVKDTVSEVEKYLNIPPNINL